MQKRVQLCLLSVALALSTTHVQAFQLPKSSTTSMPSCVSRVTALGNSLLDDGSIPVPEDGGNSFLLSAKVDVPVIDVKMTSIELPDVELPKVNIDMKMPNVNLGDITSRNIENLKLPDNIKIPEIENINIKVDMEGLKASMPNVDIKSSMDGIKSSMSAMPNVKDYVDSLDLPSRSAGVSNAVGEATRFVETKISEIPKIDLLKENVETTFRVPENLDTMMDPRNVDYDALLDINNSPTTIPYVLGFLLLLLFFGARSDSPAPSPAPMGPIDVSIPYDAAARLAYDETTSKFDEEEYAEFKKKYEEDTIAMVTAKKLARDEAAGINKKPAPANTAMDDFFQEMSKGLDEMFSVKK